MASRPATEPTGSESPYLAARREWNERYGSYIKQAAMWRAAAFGSMLVALVAVFGVVYIGSRSKIVPYVVKVDKLGQAVAVGPADVASEPDERVIVAQLARWLYDVRSVYTDAGAERQLINQAYATVADNSAALTSLNAYFQANDPFKRAQSETVTVQVESVLPISDKTWRIEWAETVSDRSGGTTTTTQSQADAAIAIKPPSDPATIIQNPEGVYVTSFNWSKRL